MLKKPNIILITIDALRADHLGFMGYGKETSPNIDKLAKESVVFTQAYAVASATPYSFPAILTSTYPFDYQGHKKMNKPRKLISEVLKEKGYTTVAFHCNPFLTKFFGYNKGWDYFEYHTSSSNISPGPSSHFKRRIKTILNKFSHPLIKLFFSFFSEFFFRIEYLLYKLGRLKIPNQEQVKAAYLNQIIKEFIYSAEGQSPFFIWIHYGDVHTPYLPYDYRFKPRTLSYSELSSKGDPLFFIINNYTYPKNLQKILKKRLGKIIDLYDQGIKYVDEQLGDLLDFFKEKDIYQNSIICVSADHGDEFLEHEGISHASHKLYNEVLHVPLLIKYPGGSPQIINKKVSLIDLSPTLIGLAGFDTPSCFKGKNLFRGSERMIFHQAIASSGVWSEHKMACQNEEWKYIIDYSTGQEELYNLFEDPGEKNNLSQEKSAVLFQMRKRIKEFVKENPPLSLLKEREKKSNQGIF